MIVTRGLDSGGLRPAEQGALDLPIEPPGTVISPAPPSAPAFRDGPVPRVRASCAPAPPGRIPPEGGR